MKLFVEGGGDSTALKSECREGFKTFITKAGITKRPRIVACGSRSDAYNDFCTALNNNEEALLLVDSEENVDASSQEGEDRTKWLPWKHLNQRKGDEWEKPKGSEDTDCHLMVQVMETWFLADRAALAAFFGNGFKQEKLPATERPIEGISKVDVYRALKVATADCRTKAQYGKGAHSFKILATLDPAKVTSASAWAARFVDTLKKKMG
ncbi:MULTISPECIES: DUF4276 family protein [Sphingomonas]|uniref:DUF4276 family protein n=1 Tax=Sphingomonas trueperi TaxID=53317 RepID=A0A7X6BF77_9SPHN|nr:DUF4276 family protein [Sphingomonas sp. ABOLD]NJC00096.1 hypothetical protein [Sphingomonas trueperi]